MTSPFRFLKGLIPADPAEVETVCLRLRGLMAEAELGSRDAFALELLAREALSNAVRYGCRNDPGRRVRLAVRLGRRAAVLSVQDDGPGFDWRAGLAVPADDYAARGRGLRIYRAYASRMFFNAAGNRILLIRSFPEPAMTDSNATDPGPKLVLQPGDMVAATVEPLRARLKAMLQGGARDLTIDLAGVRMVDSMGIGLMIQASNSLARIGGSFRVVNPSEDLAELFRSMRLDKWFQEQV